MPTPILKLAEQVAALNEEAQAAVVAIADTLRKSGASAPRRGRPRLRRSKAVVAPAPKAKSRLDKLAAKA